MLRLGTIEFYFIVNSHNIIYFLVVIFILELFMISVTQSQKYLECTFDVGDLPCRLIPVGTTPELNVISFITVDNLSIDPLMPLSDVTSISK